VGALVARLRELHRNWNAVQVKAALYDLAEAVPTGGVP
jgi:hypothetical protein